MATMLWTSLQDSLNEEGKYLLEERAAIIEEGNRGMRREEAEKIAAIDYRRSNQRDKGV